MMETFLSVLELQEKAQDWRDCPFNFLNILLKLFLEIYEAEKMDYF